MTKIKESSTNNRNRKAALSTCPVYYTLEKIGGRWKTLILFNLVDGKKRYGELKKRLPYVTEKMLIQQLKELEADGLIIRKALPVVPPHVEYCLSKTGKELNTVLGAMAQWGLKNQQA
jgi:DNA-binding HxlR family transcriptional regulator